MTIANDQFLDMAAAMRFREANPPTPECNGMASDADLSIYTRADPDALEFLAGQGYDSFACIGLEHLDERTATVLAGWDAFLCFPKLEQLDAEVAKILVAGGNQLALENLHEPSVEAVCELARLDSMLCLGLDSLSTEIAAELARHSHEMDLRLKVPPSDQALHALCSHAGYRLHVQWVRPLGEQPCAFLPLSKKKVFVIPQFVEDAGQWFENVYIGDADFYPDSPISAGGIITLL